MTTRSIYQKLEYLIIAVIALFLAVFPVCVLADTTIITNSVKASASSGGNTASGNGEQIITGETEVDIFIETVVNGETVEYIDEHYEGSDIPDGGIHKETHYESEDETVVVDTDIVVNVDGSDDDPQVVGKETAAVIEAVAKIEEQLGKTEETEEEFGEAKPATAIGYGEAKDETEDVGLISFISSSIANLFKYVLSIFA